MRNIQRGRENHPSSDERTGGQAGRRMWRRAPLFAALVLVIALGVTVVSQLFLPSYVQRALRDGIQSSLDEHDALDVRISSTPALELLTGSVDTIGIEARGLRSDNLRIDALSIDGSRVKIDVWRLARDGQLVIQSASNLDATLTITEEDLNEYYWAEVDPNQALAVEMKKDAVGLTGSLNILGQAVQIDVSGHFEVRGPTKVAFLPDEFSIQDAKIPSFLVDALLDDWELVLRIDNLPVNLSIDEIRIEDDRALLHAAYAG